MTQWLEKRSRRIVLPFIQVRFRLVPQVRLHAAILCIARASGQARHAVKQSFLLAKLELWSSRSDGAAPSYLKGYGKQRANAASRKASALNRLCQSVVMLDSLSCEVGTLSGMGT